jgi:hypothetical protein
MSHEDVPVEIEALGGAHQQRQLGHPPAVLYEMKIRPADAAGQGADQDLTHTRSGVGHLVDDHRALPQDRCSHMRDANVRRR